MNNLPSLILPRNIQDAIIAHAREGKPEEICGLLRGMDGIVIDYQRARNVAPNPIMDYEVDPKALLVQFLWEEQGDGMVAIYHSHPEDPAYPSASDAINAHYPDAVYIICSLLDGAMTNCLFAHELTAVTAEMTVRFRHPIATGQRATVRACLESSMKPLHMLTAEVLQNGCVMAVAKGKFVEKPDLAWPGEC